MRYFIVASHGPLSASILESAALIAGKESVRNFRSIGVTMDDSLDKIRESVDCCLSGIHQDDEIVALTDVYGGSVTNVLAEYIPLRKLCIVTGMNLGMVIEAGFSCEDMPMDKLIEMLLDSGKTGIQCVNFDINSKSEDEI